MKEGEDRIKRIIALILIVLLLTLVMISCNESKFDENAQRSTEGTMENATTEIGNLGEMELTVVGYFGDASDYPKFKEDWPKWMEQEYGIKFKVNFPPRNNYLEKVNLMITSGDIKGIILYFTPDDVVKAIYDDVIEPLDTYLEDNSIYKSLPESMRLMYRFYDKTWAIPKGLTPNIFSRAIRKDWLDNLGLKVPETVDELYEACRQFTFNDPDGNGKDDTYGTTSSSSWLLQDIFQAFDARLNHVGGSPITWDPNDNCWVDSMLKPGMVDALSLLAKMYKEGSLDRELFTNSGANAREKILSGQCGGTFYWYDWIKAFETGTQKSIPEAEFVGIHVLKGRINKNINHISYSNAPYVLVKGTKQPKEVINTFVNIFFGDEKGHFLGRLGIPGHNTYEIQDKTIVIHEFSEGQGPPSAGILEEIPKYSRENYPYKFDYMDEEWHERTQESIINKAKVFEEGIKNGTMYFYYQTNQVPLSDAYARLDADSKRIFTEALVKSITGEKTIEDALNIYRTKMKAIGCQQILDEANAAIGAECKYKY